MLKDPFSNIKVPIIALTGGIATGKTTVACEFKRLGAVVVDCDAISRRECFKGKPALGRIAKCFSRAVLKKDGTLDRKALGRIIFADKTKRRRLEAILHPYIIRDAARQLKEHAGKRLAILDAPLLFEAGLDRFVDKVILVWTTGRIQKERLGKRDKLDEHAIYERIVSQYPLNGKKKKADFLIDNSKSPGATKERINKIWRVLTKNTK